MNPVPIGATVSQIMTQKPKPTWVAVDFHRNKFLEEFRKAGYCVDNANADAVARVADYCARRWLGVAKKGILLTGSTGTGKTFLLKIVSGLLEIALLDAPRLVEIYRDDKEEYKCKLSLWWQNTSKHKCPFDMIIDDIGAEPILVDYGMRMELMGTLIYDRYKRFPDAFTLFSTNLPASELAKRYDNRMWSRLQHMCEIIPLTGKDRRI